MTIRLTLIILFSALILVGCKKELEPLQDNIETPIFFVSGDIDTVPFSFTAGEKGYYMETQFIQQRDTFGNPLPLSLRSYLTKKNCLNCQKSFSIYVMSTNSDPSFSSFFIKLFWVVLIYVFQLIGLFVFSFLIKEKTESFIRNKLAFIELTSLILFVALFLSIYTPINNNFLIPIVITLAVTLNMVVASTFLSGIISNFHNILYLCMLEIIPVLILLRII